MMNHQKIPREIVSKTDNVLPVMPVNTKLLVKFGYSEKATKFEKIFHLKFDATK